MREFSFVRLYHLVRNRIVADLTPVAIGGAILVGLELIAFLSSFLGSQPFTGLFTRSDGTFLVVLVMLGSFLVSSRAFVSMQSPRSTTEWLLLPATSLEKYAAAVVSTQVLVPVLSLVAAGLFWFTAHGMDLLRLPAWQGLGAFLVGNVLLMTGSTVYRKWAGLKSFGTMVAFLLGITLVSAVVLRLFVGDVFRAEGDELVLLNKELHFSMMGKMKSTGPILDTLWQLMFYLVTPVAAVAFGVFRVREKEARDAVQ